MGKKSRLYIPKLGEVRNIAWIEIEQDKGNLTEFEINAKNSYESKLLSGIYNGDKNKPFEKLTEQKFKKVEKH